MPEPSRTYLDHAYEVLGYRHGSLLSVDADSDQVPEREWLAVEDWLILGREVGADAIFFVDDSPVIVFAESTASDEAMMKAFNRVWNMARPALLFLATPGFLSAYHLSRAPLMRATEWQSVEPLAIAERVADVAARLSAFRREMVESGQVFENGGFKHYADRADKALIRDLKTVRGRLLDLGLDDDKVPYAHALIGRSIFIRYLEDRGILTREYFEKVAVDRDDWKRLLREPLEKPLLNPEMQGLLYPRILQSKAFTYALYNQLNFDFNGDIFPTDSEEYRHVSEEHLLELRDMFLGDADPQQSLFFWAYKFNIIPIELISSIYEEFYHSARREKDDKGTHYTAISLVDFTLSRALTVERLKERPRVVDPACGSGIFLVEAFRRIVRYERRRRGGRPLTREELLAILRDQIAGIEINPEAIRVSAFSLYLALLNYLEPPDILHQIEQSQQLPHFIYNEKAEARKDRFDILLCANAFDIEKVAKSPQVQIKYGSESADIVVGNPPFDIPPLENLEARKALSKGEIWCTGRGFPVGSKSPSQMFVWRAFDLLKEGGCASLLLSTGVFFNYQNRTQAFRRLWLERVELDEVVNFAHVRRLFFAEGTSPFAAVTFSRCGEAGPSPRHTFPYWSAKRTARVAQTQAVVLSRADLNVVQQRELLNNDLLWKVYWWGNHRDAALIQALELNPALGELISEEGRGFEITKRATKQSDRLRNYHCLNTDHFQSYGPLDPSILEDSVPGRVYRTGNLELYEGWRLLITRGKSTRGKRLRARIAEQPFCFLNSIQGFKLRSPEPWKYKIVLGILWSSLARYYLFLTSGSWGPWHDEVRLREMKRLPIRLPEKEADCERLLQVVRRLREWKPETKSLFNPSGFPQEEVNRQLAELEEELDSAVFDLYRLSRSDRALVKDLCNYGFDLLYHGHESQASSPVKLLQSTKGLLANLPNGIEGRTGMPAYLHAFLDIWNRELPSGEFFWRVVHPQSDWPLVAVVFSIADNGNTPSPATEDTHAQWRGVLDKLSRALLNPYGSDRIYIDGFARIVTDTDIIIIKRNEQRLWTQSAAYEDAEATLLQVMQLRAAEQSI